MPSETLFECLNEEEIYHDEQIPDLFPIIVPGTVCLGDTSLSSHARTYAYARWRSLARHFERNHLRLLPSMGNFLCPHPSCTAQEVHLVDVAHFKNHAATVHNVFH